MTRSSLRGTFQTSLTPSAHTCGSRPAARSNSRIAAPVRWPQVPSARTVAWAVTSEPGSKLPSGLPSLPRPLSPERMPRTTPSSTSSCGGRGLGEDVGAGLLGLVGQPARQLGDRDDVVAVVAERRRRRLERQGPVRAQHPVDGVLVDLAVGGPVLGLEVGEELLQARRAHHRAREVVGTADLALLDHGHRHLAEALHQLRLVGQQLQQLVRAREAGGAAADDGDPDLDALLLVIELALDELLLGVDGGRELRRRDDPAVRRRHALSRPSSP